MSFLNKNAKYSCVRAGPNTCIINMVRYVRWETPAVGANVCALPELDVALFFFERLSDSAEHGDMSVGGSRKSMRGV